MFLPSMNNPFLFTRLSKQSLTCLFLCNLLLVQGISAIGEVYWGVNCGGDQHTDIHGIKYQRDTLSSGIASGEEENFMTAPFEKQEFLIDICHRVQKVGPRGVVGTVRHLTVDLRCRAIQEFSIMSEPIDPVSLEMGGERTCSVIHFPYAAFPP